MITTNSSGNPISADFIAALTADNRQYEAVLLDGGTPLNCAISRLAVTKGSSGGEDGFAVGSVVGSTLTAEVKGLTTAVKGKEIEARIGLEVGGSFEYVTLGFFTITEVQQTAYATTLTGYGKIITKTGDAFTVPATASLANIAASIASSVSALAGTAVTVTFDGAIDTTEVITASLNGLTVYQALEVLAGVCGGFATDTADGNIKIYRFDDTADLARDTSTMIALPVTAESDFTIAGTLVTVTEESEDEDGQVIPAVTIPATPTGTENLFIFNPYMTQGLYTDNIAPLTGYTYRPASIGLTYGDPRLEGSDVVSVTDVDGAVYSVPCHVVTHTFDGGFTSAITAAEATPQENEVASAGGSLTEQLSAVSASVISARTSAETAKAYAQAAKTTTDEINAYATLAGKTVTQILNDGETAGTAAAQAQADAAAAKAQAENAGEYAARALGNLSTVQSVAETLTYITQHGTMTLTTDVALDPTHVYFVQDAGGDYTVGGVTYAIVTEPDVADIATYYELTIDESLQNYVGTHLSLTGEGLWLLPATSGTNKVLIATGAGSQYTIAGTYLIDASGNTVASFRADGVTIGESTSGKTRSEISSNGMQIVKNDGGAETQIANLGWGRSYDEQGQLTYGTFYTLGTRENGSDIGGSSLAEGVGNIASGYASHAEGISCQSLGSATHAEGEGSIAGNGAIGAHAEGYGTFADNDFTHAENYITTAKGEASHAQNSGTYANSHDQTTLGSYNVIDTTTTTKHASGAGLGYSEYAIILGNGTADNARSNALTVDWQGNVMAQGFAGKVEMFAGAVTQTVTSGVATTTGAPAGWLLCDGSTLNVSEYPELAAVLGSLYGGDGTTTFALPDLRGRFPLGVGNGTASGHTNHALASSSGAEKVTLAAENMPYHRHALGQLTTETYAGFKPSLQVCNVATGSTSTSDNPITYAGTNRGTSGKNNAYTGASNTGGSHSHKLTAGQYTNYAGGSNGAATAHDNMPPFIGLNFIIATGKTS